MKRAKEKNNTKEREKDTPETKEKKNGLTEVKRSNAHPREILSPVRSAVKY